MFASLTGVAMAQGKGRVEIIAPKTIRSPHSARFAVRISSPAKRIAFFVDNRRRWVARSDRWKFSHRGRLRTARMAKGPHKLRIRAKLSNGRIAGAGRVLYVAGARKSSTHEHSHKNKESTTTESATETAPAPSPSPGPLLDAGFEEGLLNWNIAGVGEIVPSVVTDIVRSGSKAAKFELTGSQGRSELILGGNGTSAFDPVKFTEGSEYYYGFSFNIQSMVYGHPGAHNLIMQFKSEGTGSPNFGLQLWDYAGDDGHSGGRGLWSSGEAMGGDRFLTSVAEQQWHVIVIRFKASSQSSGFYEVYVDDKLVDSRSGVSMIVPGRSYAYIKNGIYRNGGTIPGTSQLRVDAAKLGTSASAVLPN